MIEKTITNTTVLPEINVTASVKTKIDSIFTLFKNTDGVPLKMGFDGTLNQFVAKLKSIGIKADGRNASILYSKAITYLEVKYPENVIGTVEHATVNVDYYDPDARELIINPPKIEEPKEVLEV